MTPEIILQTLGISLRFKGYRRTLLALTLAFQDECRLEAVTTDIYMEVAKQLHCNWMSVEHSIRTSVKRAWNVNRKFLIEMAGYDLVEAPTSADFLSICVSYLQRSAKVLTR